MISRIRILLILSFISIFMLLILSMSHVSQEDDIKGDWYLYSVKSPNIKSSYREMYINETNIIVFGGPLQNILLDVTYSIDKERLFIYDDTLGILYTGKFRIKDSILDLKINDSIPVISTFKKQTDKNALSKYFNQEISKNEYRKSFFLRELEWKKRYSDKKND